VYGTNHLNNGEFVAFGSGTGLSRLTFDLAPASQLAANVTASAGSSLARKCGGVTRSILCCARCP
jgi:hypothetical protein